MLAYFDRKSVLCVFVLSKKKEYLFIGSYCHFVVRGCSESDEVCTGIYRLTSIRIHMDFWLTLFLLFCAPLTREKVALFALLEIMGAYPVWLSVNPNWTENGDGVTMHSTSDREQISTEFCLLITRRLCACLFYDGCIVCNNTTTHNTRTIPLLKVCNKLLCHTNTRQVKEELWFGDLTFLCATFQ